MGMTLDYKTHRRQKLMFKTNFLKYKGYKTVRHGGVPFNPAFRRPETGQPGLYNWFQAGQGYTGNPVSTQTKQNNKRHFLKNELSQILYLDRSFGGK